MCWKLVPVSFFLTLNAAYILGLTETACENTMLNINCPIGQALNVTKATYGRQDHSTCPSIFILSINCYSPTAFNILQERCNGKESCGIVAANSQFGDPCAFTWKYLQVTYECIESKLPPQTGNATTVANSQNGKGNVVTACENQILDLHCKPSERIKITLASYGRHDVNTCVGLTFDLNCHAATSVELMEQRCNGKSSCAVLAANSVFGDPCAFTSKYLQVTYDCIDDDKATEKIPQAITTQLPLRKNALKRKVACQNDLLELECQSGSLIHVHDANYGRTDNVTCDFGSNSNTNCRAATCLGIVTLRCHEKQSCNIYAENSLFEDPCPDTFKYLEVYYECVSNLV